MQNKPSKKQLIVEITSWIIGLIVSAIGVWFLPQKYHFQVVFAALGAGILFDLLSLYCYVMSLMTKQYMSGFPGISLIFYVWFIAASTFSLVAVRETQIERILLFKLVDAGVLYGFSFLCHFPARFQPSRNRSDDE